ncbi:MAG TPA: hypothetical protein VGM30_10320 [Puia sp.]|jgi:hypothetical protein
MEQVEIIKPGAVVNIAIGDSYYGNLQELTVFYSKMVSPEELALQVNNIKENKPLSEWGHNFKTLLTLINEVESQAKAQNLTELVTVSA